MIKIKLHSATDLITNSSTVIFTYSEGCTAPLKEMINEILKSFGVEKTFDEMFDTVVLNDSAGDYEEYYAENLYADDEKFPEGVDKDTDFQKLWDDVATGKVKKPDWFKKVEEQEGRYDYYRRSTYLYIIPKDEKYAKLAKLIYGFLYSTDHEATRDG